MGVLRQQGDDSILKNNQRTRAMRVKRDELRTPKEAMVYGSHGVRISFSAKRVEVRRSAALRPSRGKLN
jgi:hypothetical protein